jgi:hypothetical protein
MNAVVLIPPDELHRRGQVRWSQSQRPMRPMPVVVVDVDPEHSREMLPPDDQQPVEALGADGLDPALRAGVRVRRLHRCDQHLGTLRAEDIVEPTAELHVTIADEEAHAASLFLQVQQKVAGLLDDPGGVGLPVTPARWTRRVPSR